MLCLPTALRESLARPLHWSILEQVQRVSRDLQYAPAPNLSFVCILLTSARKMHPSSTIFSRKLAPKWYPHSRLSSGHGDAAIPSRRMPSDRDLLARIGRSPGSRAGYKQLVRELGLGGGRERRLLLEQLARLSARGDLVKAGRDHWGLPTGSLPLTPISLRAGSTCTAMASASSAQPAISAREAKRVTTSLFRPPSSTAPCRAISFWSSSSRPARMARTPASAPAASSRSPTAATPPSSAASAMPRANAHRATTSSPSTSA